MSDQIRYITPDKPGLKMLNFYIMKYLRKGEEERENNNRKEKETLHSFLYTYI